MLLAPPLTLAPSPVVSFKGGGRDDDGGAEQPEPELPMLAHAAQPRARSGRPLGSPLLLHCRQSGSNTLQLDSQAQIVHSLISFANPQYRDLRNSMR
jgi:hypothetical protein